MGRRQPADKGWFLAAAALAACLPGLPLSALDPSRPISQYGRDVWRIEQGLPQDLIDAFAQTSDGYLWVGTPGGLARFDGVRFTVYSPTTDPAFRSAAIDSLLADPDGSLWVTTDGGGLLHGRDGRFSSPGAKLPTDRLRALHRDPDGTLWIGTNQEGLVRLHAGVVSAAGLAGETVTDLLRDRNGVLWIGTERGLFRSDKGRMVGFSGRAGLPDGRITELLEDRNGRLWIGTARGLAFVEKDRILPAAPPGLAGGEILALLEDRNGSLWIGTRRGLGRLRNGRFELSDLDGELAGDSIRALFEDREGSLWVGAGTGGLHRLKDVAFATLTRRDGLASPIVWALHEDRNRDLWIGTESGLDLLRDGRIASFPGQDALRQEVVRTVSGDRGDLWVGTYRGLFHLHGGGADVLGTQDGLPDSRILTLLDDGQGALWIGTYRGLAVLRNGRISKVYTQGPGGQGLTNDRIFALHKDRQGAVWVGTKEGLDRIVGDRIETILPAPGTRTPSTPPTPATPPPPPILPRAVFSFSEDEDGTLWIAANTGLHRYRDGKITVFSTRDGLPEKDVMIVLDDGLGNLWLCDQGIVRVKKSDLEAYSAGALPRIPFLALGPGDGMPANGCNGVGRTSSLRSADGRIWFATGRGVATARPDNLPFNALPPPVLVESVQAGERTLTAEETAGDILLPPGTRRFQVSYTALSFIDPAEVRFRHRLRGFDREWVDAGARRSADYTSLSPGEYVFEVAARNNDGVWGQAASLPLRIAPRFHESASFAVLGGLAGLAGGLVLLRLRSRAARRRERELERLVEERTGALAEETARAERARKEAEAASRSKSEFLANVSHEIRTPMNAVIGMTSVLLGTSLNRDQRDWIETIRRSGEELLIILNDILDLSKIEAGRLEMETLRLSVQDCVEEAVELMAETAARKRLEIGCLVEAGVPAAVYSDATRLRQVLVNFLGNAVKFTSQGEVFLSVDAAPQPGGISGSGGIGGIELRFAIRDTGPGIAAESMHRLFKPFSQADSSITRLFGGTGLGLVISQRLVDRLGGTITVESEPGRGSTFSFSIGCRAAPPDKPDKTRLLAATEGLAGKRLLLAGLRPPARRIVEGYARQWGLVCEDAAGAPAPPQPKPDLALVDQEDALSEAWLTALEWAWIPTLVLRRIGVRTPGEDGSPQAVHRPIHRTELLIAVRSALGLPVGSLSSSLGREDTAEIREGLGVLRILLAEDNSVNQMVGLLLLERLGYRADVAANGLEVLEALRRQTYDVILMDVQMPEMDGLEATRRILAEWPPKTRPRIVAMTANALRGDREACLEAGMDDYLSKPILLEDLRQALLRSSAKI